MRLCRRAGSTGAFEDRSVKGLNRNGREKEEPMLGRRERRLDAKRRRASTDVTD